MSNTASTRIVSVYKSRKIILELLAMKGFDIKEYMGFSINEVDAMYTNGQLDMLISHEHTSEKAYIKYYSTAKQTSKQIRPANLDEIIEDLYSIEQVLTNADTLVIIIDDEPNDTIITKVKYLYDHFGIFVVIYNINRLQFNILHHTLVPPTVVLTDLEKTDIMKKYHLKDDTTLPEISRFDPVALATFMRPGQVCKIVRESNTALSYNYYRICV